MPLFLYFSGSGHFAIRPPWPASHHTCCRRTQCSQRSQCKCVHRPAGAAPSRRAAEARCAPSCHSPRCMPGLPVSRITTDGNHVGRVAGSADGIACGRRGRTYSPAHPGHARLRRALTRPAQGARLASHSCCPPGPGDRRAVVRRVGGRVRGGRCGWRARRGRGRGAGWRRQHDGRAHGRRAEPGAQAHLAHGRDGNERRCNQAADRLHLRAGRAPASLPRARCLLPGAAGEPAPPVRAGGSLASGAAIGAVHLRVDRRDGDRGREDDDALRDRARAQLEVVDDRRPDEPARARPASAYSHSVALPRRVTRRRT